MFSAQDAGLTIDLPMHDNCRLVFGDGDDLYMAWDGTDFDIVPASSGSGIVFGAASYGLGVNVGVFSSLTAGSGYPLATATPGALKVYSDDAGASIADSVRGVLSRTLLTVDQAGASIRALMGQLKLKTGADVQTGIYTGVQGYVEMAGTHSAKTGSTLSCVDASAEIGTALTVDSGGEFFGVHVETTGAGTITNSGTCAAIGVTKASGAASWPVGLYLSGCVRGISFDGVVPPAAAGNYGQTLDCTWLAIDPGSGGSFGAKLMFSNTDTSGYVLYGLGLRSRSAAASAISVGLNVSASSAVAASGQLMGGQFYLQNSGAYTIVGTYESTALYCKSWLAAACSPSASALWIDDQSTTKATAQYMVDITMNGDIELDDVFHIYGGDPGADTFIDFDTCDQGTGAFVVATGAVGGATRSHSIKCRVNGSTVGYLSLYTD